MEKHYYSGGRPTCRIFFVDPRAPFLPMGRRRRTQSTLCFPHKMTEQGLLKLFDPSNGSVTGSGLQPDSPTNSRSNGSAGKRDVPKARNLVISFLARAQEELNRMEAGQGKDSLAAMIAFLEKVVGRIESDEKAQQEERTALRNKVADLFVRLENATNEVTKLKSPSHGEHYEVGRSAAPAGQRPTSHVDQLQMQLATETAKSSELIIENALLLRENVGLQQRLSKIIAQKTLSNLSLNSPSSRQTTMRANNLDMQFKRVNQQNDHLNQKVADLNLQLTAARESQKAMEQQMRELTERLKWTEEHLAYERATHHPLEMQTRPCWNV